MLKGKNKQTNKQTHQLVRLSDKLQLEMKAVRLHSASRHSTVDTEVPVHSSHIQCYVAKSVETWEHQLPPCAVVYLIYTRTLENKGRAKLGVIQSSLIVWMDTISRFTEFNLGRSKINFTDKFVQSLP